MTLTLLSRKPAIALAVAACVLLTLPFWAADQYQLHLAALIAVYWVLIAGLNLVVGYTGQLSIGHVGLLSIGSYAFCILVGKWGLDPFTSTALAGMLGGLCGLALGLPSLRLPGFYFAMATMAFALIVNEIILAQVDLTGGGVGLMGPLYPEPFDSPAGFYYLALLVAAFVTLLTWNLARSMWGRGLMAVRDNPVTAQSVGVPVFRAKLVVFVFSGVTAGVSGALFASLQSYITPETFVFELSMFFFVCIIIGGRGSILGPLLGTVVLTALPEMVASLAKLGNFFYGLLLLVVVLLIPEGIGRMLEKLYEKYRPRKERSVTIAPELKRLEAAIGVAIADAGHPDARDPGAALRAVEITKQFGGLVALEGVSITLTPGQVHGLIGPNGSGKTTMLNMLCGYYQPTSGTVNYRHQDIGNAPVQDRARLGIARTFQKPRLLPELTVLENVMLGAWQHSRAGFVDAAFGLPSVRAEDQRIREQATELLMGVGLGAVMHWRANLLDHAQQRFLEIARGLALGPRFLLLDEPAGGLTGVEIDQLGMVIRTIRHAGVGVLLVEHHTDFVFRVCDDVTALNVGRMIRHGTPGEVRHDPEVIRVYLGA
jgi:ABC-type branched-subunit amino acid transport system ATPase component/ABC-type branched-subunit amino acid transport system permease subunit